MEGTLTVTFRNTLFWLQKSIVIALAVELMLVHGEEAYVLWMMGLCNDME